MNCIVIVRFNDVIGTTLGGLLVMRLLLPYKGALTIFSSFVALLLILMWGFLMLLLCNCLCLHQVKSTSVGVAFDYLFWLLCGWILRFFVRGHCMDISTD